MTSASDEPRAGGKPRILIVDDDETLRGGLVDCLELEGYEVAGAGDGREGLDRIRERAADLVLLDVMMPEMTGFDVLRAMRAEGIDTPVILLTALGEELDRVRGLELGGDDYVVKPFSLRELVARIRARLRRDLRPPADVAPSSGSGAGAGAGAWGGTGTGTGSQGGAEVSEGSSGASSVRDVDRIGEATIDFDAYAVRRGEHAFEISPKEAGMLRLLIECEGKVVSRREFLNSVWGYDTFPTTRTVDTHMAKLRQKIEPDPDSPRFLRTVHGVGYKLVRPDDTSFTSSLRDGDSREADER